MSSGVNVLSGKYLGGKCLGAYVLGVSVQGVLVRHSKSMNILLPILL